MKPAAWTEKVYEIVDRAGRKDGIEAVEVHWLGSGKNRLLRIYIDKPEGVTHGECEMVSQYVGTVLDAEDLVPANISYTLEVSSPGVERLLSKPKDFERFAGQKVKIVLREPLAEEDKRTFWEGTLAGFKEGVITLQPAKGDPAVIPLDKVERANLKFEW